MVVVTELARTMIPPATDSIYQACWVDAMDDVSQAKFWVEAVSELAPAFVVDDLG